MPTRTNSQSSPPQSADEPKFWCRLVDEDIMKMLLAAEAAIQHDLLCSNDRSAKHTSQLYLLDLLLYVTHKRPLYPAAVTWLKGFVSFLISSNVNEMDQKYPLQMPPEAPIPQDEKSASEQAWSTSPSAVQQNVAWPSLYLPLPTAATTITMIRTCDTAYEQSALPHQVSHEAQRMPLQLEEAGAVGGDLPSLPSFDGGASNLPEPQQEVQYLFPSNIWDVPTRDDERYYESWINYLKCGIPLESEALVWMIIAIVKIHRNLMLQPSLRVFSSLHSSDRSSDIDH